MILTHARLGSHHFSATNLFRWTIKFRAYMRNGLTQLDEHSRLEESSVKLFGLYVSSLIYIVNTQ